MPTSTPRSTLITGGASGIGLAIAAALHADGHQVAVADVDRAALARLPERLADDGRLLAVHTDVSDEASCNACADAVVSRFGTVHALVNNAGIGVSSLRHDAETRHPGIEELTPDMWRRFFDVNVLGAIQMTRACLAPMKAAGWGRIVNNTTSYLTMHRVQPYGAVKSALESASAVWAKELDGSGITVNVVVPGGPTDTPFVGDIGIPREKMLRPDVMVPPLRWLMSEEADGMTGRRFVAGHWNTSLSPAAAAAACARGIGWPELTGDVIWAG